MQVAYAKTQTAETLEQYEEIIRLCDKGVKQATDKASKDYLTKLLAWGYNRRGKLWVNTGCSAVFAPNNRTVGVLQPAVDEVHSAPATPPGMMRWWRKACAIWPRKPM